MLILAPVSHIRYDIFELVLGIYHSESSHECC